MLKPRLLNLCRQSNEKLKKIIFFELFYRSFDGILSLCNCVLPETKGINRMINGTKLFSAEEISGAVTKIAEAIGAEFKGDFKECALVGLHQQGVPLSVMICKELEKKYGVRIYFEILPRQMSNEQFKARALDLYDCGAERIALWDTYGRAMIKTTWSTVRRLGHKNDLANMDVGEGELYRTLFMLKVGDRDLNRFNPDWGG